MSKDSFVSYVLDQLRDLGSVDSRSMFGGHGIYHDSVFFAIVADDRLYFKTDERTREAYRSQGMGPFRASEKQTLTSYYEVPADVLEDDEALCLWAEQAVGVARTLNPKP
jgi:DNA transformation protein